MASIAAWKTASMVHGVRAHVTQFDSANTCGYDVAAPNLSLYPGQACRQVIERTTD